MVLDMVIDTNDENIARSMEEKKEDLIKQKRDKGFYTSQDIALVRATPYFPKNGIVYAIDNVPFVCKLNDEFREVAENHILKLNEKLEKLTDYDKRMKLINDINKKAEEYIPWSTQYRSSIHYCLNGVVSSHMQGSFDDSPVIIIEPFSVHENDSNILAVRGEDTYFANKLQLSDKTIILVEESSLDEIVKQNINPHITIIPYRGNRDIALQWVLIGMMDIVPEIIGKDYIIESETSQMITDFIRRKNYPLEKHCYSKSYQEDDEKNLILWKMYAKNFYTYLFSQFGDIAPYQSLIDKLSDPAILSRAKKVEILEKIIQKIGIDNYANIVRCYNHSIDEQIRLETYPTNKEILNGASLNLSEYKKITR